MSGTGFTKNSNENLFHDCQVSWVNMLTCIQGKESSISLQYFSFHCVLCIWIQIHVQCMYLTTANYFQLLTFLFFFFYHSISSKTEDSHTYLQFFLCLSSVHQCNLLLIIKTETKPLLFHLCTISLYLLYFIIFGWYIFLLRLLSLDNLSNLSTYKVHTDYLSRI